MNLLLLTLSPRTCAHHLLRISQAAVRVSHFLVSVIFIFFYLFIFFLFLVWPVRLYLYIRVREANQTSLCMYNTLRCVCNLFIIDGHLWGDKEGGKKIIYMCFMFIFIFFLLPLSCVWLLFNVWLVIPAKKKKKRTFACTNGAHGKRIRTSCCWRRLCVIFHSLSSYTSLPPSLNKCWPRDIRLVDRDATIFIKAIRLTMSLSALNGSRKTISGVIYWIQSTADGVHPRQVEEGKINKCIVWERPDISNLFPFDAI